MNEELITLLRHANVPHSLSELSNQTGLEAPALQAQLDELEAAGLVARSKKNKYALPEKLGLIAGRAYFQHNGTPALHPLDGSETLHIESEGQLRAMPDDLLLARPAGDKGCNIERIISRGKQTLSVLVRMEQPRRRGFTHDAPALRATAVACDPRIPYAVALGGDLSFAKNNTIALAEIDEYPEGNRPILAHIARVLGPAGSMLARLRSTAEDHGFPTEFPANVETEAASLAGDIDLPKQEAREDLREDVIFTIDGASSRDFDDAVSLEVLPDGWRLGVHIADVSHYVRLGSAIDREALERGTSLYLPGYTVPMLPEVLSNDLCSLVPDQDRFTMSLLMEIDADGHVRDHHLSRSIIRSHARLTYEGVNRLFDGGDEDMPADVIASLMQMRTLALTLRKRRRERGTIDFDLAEAEFVLDEKYEPTDILCPERGEAERLIEEFMLLANETVARLARDTETPFLYRVHETPNPDRVHTLETFLNLAYQPVHLGDHPHPGILQGLLDKTADSPNAEIIRKYMLRTLKKARYSETPLGHYALSLEDYCHFTSPIRRYPDLCVHRMLKLLLDGRSGAIRRAEAVMPTLANDCSLREQESVKAERDADDIMKAAYMAKQIGRKFDGMISGVTGWGVYVTLNNTVEGLVHVAEMDDYFTFDAERQTLTGADKGMILRLGLRVRVQMVSADVERGEINFRLVEAERAMPAGHA